MHPNATRPRYQLHGDEQAGNEPFAKITVVRSLAVRVVAALDHGNVDEALMAALCLVEELEEVEAG